MIDKLYLILITIKAMRNFIIISLSSMEEQLLRRAQQSGGSQFGTPKRSKTFQISNAETSTQHGSFEQEQSRACRQEDGAGGPPWCWWGNCGQRPRSTTMALPLHFGAKAQSHGGSTHDPHHDTTHRRKKWDKVALHRGGNWVGGQRRRRVLSKSDKVSIQFL